MTISSPNIEAFDSRRDVVTFPAELDGKRIVCAISSEALCDNFGGIYNAVIEAFRENRLRIETVAERLIQQGRYEADGSIMIYSHDGS